MYAMNYAFGIYDYYTQWTCTFNMQLKSNVIERAFLQSQSLDKLQVLALWPQPNFWSLFPEWRLIFIANDLQPNQYLQTLMTACCLPGLKLVSAIAPHRYEEALAIHVVGNCGHQWDV